MLLPAYKNVHELTVRLPTRSPHVFISVSMWEHFVTAFCVTNSATLFFPLGFDPWTSWMVQGKVRERFYIPVQTSQGVHQTSCTVSTSSFPGVKWVRHALATHTQLVLRLTPWTLLGELFTITLIHSCQFENIFYASFCTETNRVHMLYTELWILLCFLIELACWVLNLILNWGREYSEQLRSHQWPLITVYAVLLLTAVHITPLCTVFQSITYYSNSPLQRNKQNPLLLQCQPCPVCYMFNDRDLSRLFTFQVQIWYPFCVALVAPKIHLRPRPCVTFGNLEILFFREVF